ncbi:winged helix-turn-helix transcriptional regulator [Actinoplanes couchii]|uniref:winged helix-turn-helix transcriptional regulator n=1 Tax=Actinoplanes couchii TaxID=403638 RepID=UPI0028624D3A|nr:helix-turn-helix domain-containing protein [Actinoplanes couchii]MDR6322037.1 DNA-binding HxlR family transcriptional regulator [Actinoplanes couchii]
MSDTRHEDRACSAALARAFGFLGKRWNGMILATLLEGPAGFAELRRAVGKVHDSVLSERLNELGSAGLVERVVAEGPPLAVSYRLTERGQALLPALRELTTWAEANLPE